MGSFHVMNVFAAGCLRGCNDQYLKSYSAVTFHKASRAQSEPRVYNLKGTTTPIRHQSLLRPVVTANRDIPKKLPPCPSWGTKSQRECPTLRAARASCRDHSLKPVLLGVAGCTGRRKFITTKPWWDRSICSSRRIRALIVMNRSISLFGAFVPDLNAGCRRRPIRAAS